VVLWGGEGGKLSAPSEVELSDDAQPEASVDVRSIDFVEVGAGGAGKSLVVITSERAYLVAGGCALDETAVCESVAARRVLRLRPLDVAIDGGTALLTCDVQGDGVDDLAVIKDGVLRVFEGEPILR
jgi:hypothetical protein